MRPLLPRRRKTAATFLRIQSQFQCFGEIRSCSTQRIFNEFLFLDKKFGQLSHAHFFQVLGTWVALFGKGGSQIFDFSFLESFAERKRARVSAAATQRQFGRSL